MEEYTLHSSCIECLEQYLLFLDVGLSSSSAGFLAGLWHVTKGQRLSQFGKLARLHCMAKYEHALDADFDAMLRRQ